MTQGRLVYRQLFTAITDVTQKISTQQSNLADANKKGTEFNTSLADHYKRLAKFYLTEIDADRLDRHFDTTATKVATLLDKRDAKKAHIQTTLDEVETAVQSLESMHEQQKKDRDNAADAYEVKMLEVKGACTRMDEYGKLQSELQIATSRYDKARDRLEETSADRDEKRKPYELDRIFAYLLRVGYGTPGYDKEGLIRLCDSWLADFVGFDKAHKNYQLLLAIPDRLAEHAERLKTDIGDAEEKIDQFVDECFSESGGVPLRERLERCEDALQKTVENLSKKREHATSLHHFITDSEAGIDEYTRQALDIQRQALEAEPLADLWRRAHQTATERDDKIVTSIVELRVRLQDIESDIAKGERVINSLQERHADINRLLREYQRRDWDSGYSHFTRNLKLSDLVRKLIEGKIDADQALRHLEKAQRFKYRHADGGWIYRGEGVPGELGRGIRFPTFGSGGGGFGGFGGGGFGSGGGFGGGGFTTGGGF